ncbi:MAG: hypothetical protein CMN31_00055 [Sandaracinus sp.]|nr:hypothetical protein [Sandaracinus sp.]MBJ69758.1 hypothetical protein [Sandaracinus sp.]
MEPRRPVMGGLDVLLAVLLLLAVWLALPARWWPVDVGATALAMGFAAAGVGLLTGQGWAARVARVVATVALVAGVGLVTALVYTASSLAGLYGPVGTGGSIILTIVGLLLAPYLVVFPAAQLYFLLPSVREAGRAAAREAERDRGGPMGEAKRATEEDATDATDADADARDEDARDDAGESDDDPA